MTWSRDYYSCNSAKWDKLGLEGVGHGLQAHGVQLLDGGLDHDGSSVMVIPAVSARARYLRTDDRASRALPAIAMTLSPSATRKRRTSLIRRIADLGLGIVAVLPKGATILPVTSGSAVVHAPQKSGALSRPEVALSAGARRLGGSADSQFAPVPTAGATLS